MQRNITCSFTGHRIIATNQIGVLSSQLENAICALIHQGFTNFCSGGALGFDQLAAQTVIRLKKSFPHIRLCMVLPCKNQDEHWSKNQQEGYRQMLTLADEVIYLSEQYYHGCMQKRNRFLVDSAGVVLAYLSHNRGGTKYTVSYAEKLGVPIHFVGPQKSLQLSFL